MGKTTDLARTQLELNSLGNGDMVLGVAAFHNANCIVKDSFTYSIVKASHIEIQALEVLSRKRGLILDGSKIVIYANWSPCTKCVVEIKKYASNLFLAKRNCRVRLRYRQIYASGVWEDNDKTNRAGGGQYLWESAAVARSEYKKIERQFGYFGPNYRTVDNVEIETITPKLAFLEGNSRTYQEI